MKPPLRNVGPKKTPNSCLSPENDLVRWKITTENFTSFWIKSSSETGSTVADSVTFRQTFSNPIPSFEGRSLQAAEQPVFLPAPAVCGYCAAVVPAFDLFFQWGAFSQSFAPLGPPAALIPFGAVRLVDIPDASWDFVFTNQRLVRRPISQVLWDPPEFLNTESAFTNTCCCWLAPPLTGGVAYPNCRWYLFYTNSNQFGSPPQTQEQVPTSALTSHPLSDTDSSVSPSDDSGGDPNGTGLSTGPDIRGWILALVKKQIYALSPADPSSPLLPWFHPYALYSLHPRNYSFSQQAPPSLDPLIPFPPVAPVPDDPTVTPSSPMFNCLGRNTWVPTYNPFNWPPHLIQTIPRGP